MVKAQIIATLLLANIGSRSSRSTKASIGEQHYIERSALTREGLFCLL